MIVHCAECRAYVNATQHGSYERVSDGRGPSVLFSLLACSDCESPILVRCANIGNMAIGDRWSRPLTLYPSSGLRVASNVPQNIQAAFEEACACYQSRSFTAAAVMCRKTLEGICSAHGYKKENLAASLRSMRDDGHIEGRLYEWADSLRIAGNNAAHGVASLIGQEDAKDVVEFTAALLEYLYTFREMFEKFKLRRSANP